MSLSRVADMKNLLTQLEEEYKKFEEKGNQVAGTRARKILQDIKTMAQELRLEIQEAKHKKEEEGA